MTFKDKIFISIGTVAIIATVGSGSYLILADNSSINNNQISSNSTPSENKTPAIVDTTNQITNSNTTTTITTSPTETTLYAYKNGTYTASANYYVPKYQNSISINISIENDIIKSATASHDYTDRESGLYIDSFDSQLSSKIVGKKISDIKLSRVGGASLTTYGFNDALEIALNNAAI